MATLCKSERTLELTTVPMMSPGKIATVKGALPKGKGISRGLVFETVSYRTWGLPFQLDRPVSSRGPHISTSPMLAL